jgi:GH25 family lysozyme M1 (1,4-beta-N-acetylmuramidase)
MRKADRKQSGRKRRVLFILFLVTAAILIALLAIVSAPGTPENALGLRNLNPDWSCLNTDETLNAYRDPDSGITASAGIDVSVHQGEIDWETVRDAGVKFAIIRLGYRGYQNGGLALDQNFATNMAGAQAAGLHVGVYFFSQAVSETEAEEEADFVLKNLKGQSIDYPVVYDQETYTASSSRADGLTAEQASANCLAFCRKIWNAGYIAMVYTNSDWAQNMYSSKVLNHQIIWYADYTDQPAYTGGYAMWQYTNEGKLDGIESSCVDLDLLFLPEQNS